MYGGYFVLCEIMVQQELGKAFEKSMERLPYEMSVTLRAERQAEKEKAREEAAKERRHRELYEAIRSTSFWRIGS